jgi:4-hydroxybenzoate polyprenyltransferase
MIDYNKIKEYAKLIRLHALGTAITAVVGVLSVKGEAVEIFHFLILIFAGILFSINCAVLNDYIDIDIDRRSKYVSERPLVKGTISKKSALIISLLVLMIGVGALIRHLIITQHVLPVVIGMICIIFGLIYNFVGKKHAWGTIFAPLSMGFLLLLGATIFSEEIQNITEIPMLTWILFILTFNHLFYMNTISGGLKDIENDRESKAMTLAVYLGVRVEEKLHIPLSFKAIAVSVRSISALLIFTPFIFLDFPFSYPQLLLLVILNISMLYGMVKMLNMHYYDRKKMIRHIRLQLLTRYYLVPVMLLSFIGIFWTLVLISLPLISFAVGTVFYGHPFKSPKTL